MGKGQMMDAEFVRNFLFWGLITMAVIALIVAATEE